jgi:hypothetical protein
MGEEENGSAAALGANGNHALEHEVGLGSEGLSKNHGGGGGEGGNHKDVGAATEQITDLSGGGGGGVGVKSRFKASLLWKGSSTFDSFLLAQAAQVSL